MFRRVAGLPVLPRLDQAAQRQRAMSRCQRRTVSGVTSSRSAWRRAFGITASRVASSARSAQSRFGGAGRRCCRQRSRWRRTNILLCDLPVLPRAGYSRSHEGIRVIRRKMNRRHMTGDHHGRTARGERCWSQPRMRFSARTRHGARRPRPGRATGLAAASRCSRARATTPTPPPGRSRGAGSWAAVAARDRPGPGSVSSSRGSLARRSGRASRWCDPTGSTRLPRKVATAFVRGRPWKLHLPLFGPDSNLGAVAEGHLHRAGPGSARERARAPAAHHGQPDVGAERDPAGSWC